MRSDIRSDIKAGRLPQGYELQEADIGRCLSTGEGFGAVLTVDVGKRCYHRPWGLAMESTGQRDARLAAAASETPCTQ